MTDIADDAERREAEHRAAALSVRKPTVTPCGFCHYCNEPLRSSLLFCNTDCRDDFQAQQDAKRRNGIT
jgi:predicted nucleic acid-binding Zn ribbon protein